MVLLNIKKKNTKKKNDSWTVLNRRIAVVVIFFFPPAHTSGRKIQKRPLDYSLEKCALSSE